MRGARRTVTRLCLMGNSHLAALKLGWDRLREAHPDVAVTFFGSRGAGVCKGMRLEGGALVPSAQDLVNFRWTSGGLKEIRLEDFDCFALVALGFAPRWVWGIARRFAFADARLDQEKSLVSRECFAQAIVDVLLASTALTVARTLRGATAKTVLLVPQPATSVIVTQQAEFQAGHAGGSLERWALLREVWLDCAARVADQLGARVVFQPEETLRDHLFTAHELCRGSIRLTPDFAKEHADDDFSHMNADYGTAMMRAVLEAAAVETAAPRAQPSKSGAAISGPEVTASSKRYSR